MTFLDACTVHSWCANFWLAKRRMTIFLLTTAVNNAVYLLGLIVYVFRHQIKNNGNVGRKKRWLRVTRSRRLLNSSRDSDLWFLSFSLKWINTQLAFDVRAIRWNLFWGWRLRKSAPSSSGTGIFEWLYQTGVSAYVGTKYSSKQLVHPYYLHIVSWL